MKKKGPRPRPPRTDATELREHRAKVEAERHARLTQLFPPVAPKPATAEELMELMEPPPDLTTGQREALLQRSRAACADDAGWRRQQTKLERRMAMLVRPQPAWVRDAAYDSIKYLHKEAPVSMRPAPNPKIQVVRDELSKAGKLNKKMQASLDRLAYVAWAEGDIRRGDYDGVRAAVVHFANVERLVKAFAATSPRPSEWRDVVLRLFVPAYNATVTDRRRCRRCARIFVLRDEHQVENSIYCNDKCARAAASQKAKQRARAPDDVLGRVRARNMGDSAVDRAERALSHEWAGEDALLELLDRLGGKSHGGKVRTK